MPVRPLGVFATVGFAANNIANNRTAAFKRVETSRTSDYPMVWKNDSGSQRQFLLKSDHQGLVNQDREELAMRIWDRRSRSLIAAEVSFQSQSLVAGFAEQPVIGGRGWPNIQLNSSAEEKAFVLWGNTTLGVLSFWYFSSRQQVRRGIVTVRSIRSIPWLDPTLLSEAQLEIAETIFDEFKKEYLHAVGQAFIDETRIKLDRRVLIDLLRLPRSVLQDLSHLRDKWCSEPSIRAS